MEKETIELVKKMVEEGNLSQEIAEKYCPELKEESEDEKIRKWIIGVLSTYEHDKNLRNTAIAWLEKQGEQKPIEEYNITGISSKHADGKLGEMIENMESANKVEPKFHEGDWVVNKFGNVWHIDSFDKKNYQVSNGNKYNYFPISKQNEMHLWTIQDAKDGDVLANNHHILILRELGYSWAADGNPDSLYAYCGTKPNGNFELEQKGYCFCGSLHTHPATKEQRDLLFQKMYEAGYEWDSEKKELKKIKQKPAWSEEDKEYINDLIKYFSQNEKLKNTKEDIVIWLKSIRDRVGCEVNCTTTKEWSEEDTKMFVNIKACLRNANKDYSREIDWLKSIKPQPKNEWSEEDENRFRNLIYLVEHSKENDATKEGFIKFINKLKSLRLQNTWKPSNEQLKSLQEVIDVGHFTSYPNSLETLYEQLKKLKGE